VRLWGEHQRLISRVMARLDRAIHALRTRKPICRRPKGVDGRVKHGHDGAEAKAYGHDVSWW
jgi:hypothetical protein